MSLAATAKSLSVACAAAMLLAELPGIYAGDLFAWHPALMAVGFLGFLADGVLSAYAFRGADGGARRAAIAAHGWVQAAGAACVAGGLAAIFANKAARGKPHFATLHGKVGVLAVAALGAVAAGGTLSFRALGLLQRLPERWQPRVKWAHRVGGASAWTLGVVAMQLDLPHPAVLDGVLCRAWQAATLALIGLVLATLRQRGPGKAPLPTAAAAATGALPGPKHL